MPYLCTSMIVTQYTQLTVAEDSETVGQMIDRTIAETIENQFSAHDKPPPRIHEIRFGFETDEDWHKYVSDILQHREPGTVRRCK